MKKICQGEGWWFLRKEKKRKSLYLYSFCYALWKWVRGTMGFMHKAGPSKERNQGFIMIFKGIINHHNKIILIYFRQKYDISNQEFPVKYLLKVSVLKGL